MTAQHRSGWTTRLAGTVELDVRNNSLNLIRLVLAALVLFSHGFELGGFGGKGPLIKGDSLGTWSVFGFFAISGYLITASRFANPLESYLLKRVVRIYPAFLVCNLLTAFVVAPVAWVARGGSLGTLMTVEHSPGNYVFANLLLRMQFYDIAGGPAQVPYPKAWNGSLWSLYYEFLCYLIIGAIACIPILRRPAAIAAAFAMSVLVWANIDTVATYVGDNSQFKLLASLLPAFLGGAVYQTIHRRVPLHGLSAALAVVASAAAILWIDDWGAQAVAPLIAYIVMWLSTVLPSPQLVQRHDVSYGVYIYAFPMQQLLAVAGIHRAGVLVYDLLAATATLTCATLSWMFIESPALRRSSRMGKPAKSAKPARHAA